MDVLDEWCEVTGRGSGRKLDGVHKADVERPYGQMVTFCGVVISAAFPVYRSHPKVRCKPCSRRIMRRDLHAETDRTKEV